MAVIGMAWTMLLVFALIFGGMALTSRGVWPEHEGSRMLGLAGALAGSLVGVIGGTLGTWSTVQAARINRRLRELTLQASSSPPRTGTART